MLASDIFLIPYKSPILVYIYGLILHFINFPVMFGVSTSLTCYKLNELPGI